MVDRCLSLETRYIMDNEKHIYRARLDFLYQAIAVYAATLVLYLVIRSIADWQVFPTLWQDPLLLLLSAITFLGILALLYNFIMRRQIEIMSDAIHFTSRGAQQNHSACRCSFGSNRPSLMGEPCSAFGSYEFDSGISNARYAYALQISSGIVNYSTIYASGLARLQHRAVAAEPT